MGSGVPAVGPAHSEAVVSVWGLGGEEGSTPLQAPGLRLHVPLLTKRPSEQKGLAWGLGTGPRAHFLKLYQAGEGASLEPQEPIDLEMKKGRSHTSQGQPSPGLLLVESTYRFPLVS